MDNIQNIVSNLLEEIQGDMLSRAQKDLKDHMRFADNWEDFIKGLNDGCLVQIPFCGEPDVEDEIKRRSAADTGGEHVDASAPSMGAKSLCIPFKPIVELKEGMKCLGSGKPATQITMFGRSY